MSKKMNVLTTWWPEIVFLILISALAYVMDISQASYYRDDWYYAYDGYVAGPDIFHVMFSSDRPARGFFFEAYYHLFGSYAFPYHLGAYLWRLLGGFSVIWLLHILWPKNREANFAAVVLFITYPGYLWWVAGIEYQPQIASLCFHVASIALTLTSLQSEGLISRVALMTSSILTGWVALALVDYAIGMEVLRFLCIFLLMSRWQPVFSPTHKLVLTIRASLIPSVIPLGFVLWRLLLFEGDRQATDVGFQLGVLLNAPYETSLLWGRNLLQSIFNVSVLAWRVPFLKYFLPMNIQDQVSSLLLAIVVVILFIGAMSLNRFKIGAVTTNPQDRWQWEAVGLAFAGMVMSVLPIIAANRYISFPAFSHYALPASLAAAMLTTGAVYFFRSRSTRLLLVALLLGIAVLTHRAVSLNAIREQEIIRSFWWQVYWRIPAIQEGTTLAVIYPSIYYGEDSDIVWGPANFMYYPDKSPGTDLVRYKLAAISLTPESIADVVEGNQRKASPYRSHTMFLNYRRVLVMSQPSRTSCVHVFDGRWPYISKLDSAEHAVMFPRSNTENILTDQSISAPLEFAFGTEPIHDWCYYYEKADLAFQQGNWQRVAALGEEAARSEFVPNDLVEWMPFLYAYAYLGDQQKIESIAIAFGNDRFYLHQACEIPARMRENGYPLESRIAQLMDELFCTSGS